VTPAGVLRLLLLTGLAVLGAAHLGDAEFWSPFSGVVFGTHEFGHLFFGFAGEWMGVAGGSLMQLLIPAGAAAYFATIRRDRYAVAVCAVWMAISLANLSVYIGDARAESLDLVSFSPDGGVHDWNYLLHTMGLIRKDQEIAGFTRFAGWVVLVLGTVAGLGAVRRGNRDPTAGDPASR
jgi:hypothetical protein